MTKWFFRDNKDGLEIPESFDYSLQRGTVLALGYFDGMHIGHQKVFSEMSAYAHNNNVKAVAQTFSDIPKSKAMQSAGRGLLTTTEEKYDLMRMAGAEAVVFFPFSDHFASVGAADFFARYIYDLFSPKAIVVGHDYRFGAGRQGDVQMLIKWAAERDVEVIVVSPEIQNDRVVSSSWVRECVLSANLEQASTLLGRRMSYSGVVREGQKLGRKLGFPTANIYPDEEKIIPPHGVYVSYVQTDSGMYEAVTNIGTRPTVSNGIAEKEVVIESVIIDQIMNLYNQKITVYLAKMIREEKRFDDLESLTRQVHSDLIHAREEHRKEL